MHTYTKQIGHGLKLNTPLQHVPGPVVAAMVGRCPADAPANHRALNCNSGEVRDYRTSIMLTKIGLASARSPVAASFYRATAVRGLKTIPQPPGFVVGTVNEAYVPPKPNKLHGSLHWTLDRAVTVGLVPLAAAPLFTGVSTVVDSTLSALVLYHCYAGFQSCIIDYIPTRVYGAYHNYAMYLLTFGTGVAGYGIYQLEKKEGGITSIVSRVWKA